ncbi:CBS domain-containing protein [Polaribacter marinivivus]|jgi:CBS domain-containing protein|uniref:CBS domain-containing protein n=1 Tax=Polaribacter marinivivus TaxID=1524260 RepID=A0ABV8R7T4_9FLAO
MKNTATVKDIMTTNVITLSSSDKLENAEKLFKKNNIRHIPIVDNGEIVGMLSYSDLLRLSFADLTNEEFEIDAFIYEMFTIKQIMAKNLTMVPPNTTIKKVAQMLVEKEFHALPIVKDEKLLGIVTSTDLSRYLVAQLN